MGMLLAAGFGRADKGALLAEDRGEPGARIADRDTDAHRHENGERKHPGFPAGISGAPLRDKVERRRRNRGEEDEAECNRKEPCRELCHRLVPGEQRVGAERREKHAGMNRIVRRMEKRAELDAERDFRLEYERQVLHRGLDGTFRPAELLRLERVDVVREFGGNDDIEYEFHLPPGELAAVGKVHVFGQSVAFPAARVENRLLAPYAGGPVKVHKEVSPATGGLFHHEMPVDADGLGKR